MKPHRDDGGASGDARGIMAATDARTTTILQFRRVGLRQPGFSLPLPHLCRIMVGRGREHQSSPTAPSLTVFSLLPRASPESSPCRCFPRCLAPRSATPYILASPPRPSRPAPGFHKLHGVRTSSAKGEGPTSFQLLPIPSCVSTSRTVDFTLLPWGLAEIYSSCNHISFGLASLGLSFTSS